MSNAGENIAFRRKELKLTQEELAHRMGYKSKSTINKIELGINDIPLSKVVQFAEVLGVSTAYLMGWEEETKNGNPAEDGIPESKQRLIEFAKSVPDDKVDLVLKVMQSIVEDARREGQLPQK